jgi:hypothetical protein
VLFSQLESLAAKTGDLYFLLVDKAYVPDGDLEKLIDSAFIPPVLNHGGKHTETTHKREISFDAVERAVQKYRQGLLFFLLKGLAY